MYCIVEGDVVHDSYTKQSAHYVSASVPQVWEGIVQHLPRGAGAWSVLVCLLARRLTPALGLRWQGATHPAEAAPGLIHDGYAATPALL